MWAMWCICNSQLEKTEMRTCYTKGLFCQCQDWDMAALTWGHSVWWLKSDTVVWKCSKTFITFYTGMISPCRSSTRCLAPPTQSNSFYHHQVQSFNPADKFKHALKNILWFWLPEPLRQGKQCHTHWWGAQEVTTQGMLNWSPTSDT